MKAPEVAKHILMSCPSLSEFQAYMFGSSLIGVGRDFDILIIGPSGSALSQLKLEIRAAGSMLPLDVLYMLPEEAEETNFLERKKCISFEKLCRLNNKT
ncbi:hypothetical protein [Idiomarina seosinensis]|nr:hypothetical protein [Idiomarina seosinensis]